jgi:hypothetical protein
VFTGVTIDGVPVRENVLAVDEFAATTTLLLHTYWVLL